MGIYFLTFFSRMLLSKDMVVKGAFFPNKHFQIYVFFFRTKNWLQKYISYPWGFSKIWPTLLKHCEKKKSFVFFVTRFALTFEHNKWIVCIYVVHSHSFTLSKFNFLCNILADKCSGHFCHVLCGDNTHFHRRCSPFHSVQIIQTWT